MSKLYAEIERLTREIERLTRERDHYLEHGNLRQMSEIERLTRERNSAREALRISELRVREHWPEVDRLTRDLYEEVVENERLRAALEQIANSDSPWHTPGSPTDAVVEIAREALGEPKP